jgi:FAS-associated factor 2
VSYALQASTYPFMALIALQTSTGNSIPKMTVIERIEGASHPEELISQLDIAIERQGAVVKRLKNEREQRDLERQLLKDQDTAYRQSLKADQEKARIAQEEKEALARAEEEANNELLQIESLKERRRKYIQYLYTQLPQEPTDNSRQKVARISFRLADGERFVRKFNQDDTVDVS